ncbi:hypothetical protein ACIRJ3_10980 [Streptomyces anulatus]
MLPTTPTHVRSARTLTRAFADVVDLHADRTAPETAAERVTYAELDRRSNRAAHTLGRRGVTPGPTPANSTGTCGSSSRTTWSRPPSTVSTSCPCT